MNPIERYRAYRRVIAAPDDSPLQLGLCLSAALVLGGCTAHTRLSCAPADLGLNPDLPVLQMFRVRTGADGVSHGEMVPLEGSATRYLGMVLTQYALGAPTQVVIVNGPPNFRIPMHPAPYREMFLTLRGMVTVELSDGTAHRLTPGALLLYEDVTGPGHGGLVGPCGYTSLDLQFNTAPAPVHAAP